MPVHDERVNHHRDRRTRTNGRIISTQPSAHSLEFDYELVQLHLFG